MTTVWSVGVFAHNEAKSIQRCLDAIRTADPAVQIRVEVLVNGTTDDTMAVVGAYRPRENVTVTAHDIAIGDKANAWNVFTHTLAGEADLYVYTDGDCWLDADGLDAMARAARTAEGVNLLAGMPLTGRSRESLRADMLRHHHVAGNFYALLPDFVQRIRQHDVHMPVGLIGDDSIIGALAMWDLEPFSEWRVERVLPCPEAGYNYRSRNLLSPDDIRQQFKRMVRYSMRWHQLRMLDEVLKDGGLAAMPSHVDELYRDRLADRQPRHDLSNLLWDWLALRRMRRAAA